MPRHTQPRELAELKGAVAHDPQRYRNNPPKSDSPIGDAPDAMTTDEQACWFELVAYAPPDVLTICERIPMELAASMMAEYRDDRANFPASKMGQLIGLLARFGMTPADRQKLHVDKKDDGGDDFEAL